MFSKRRYNRKKGTRRHVRRPSKKNRILRPPTVINTVEKPTFDASGCLVYLWQYIAPKIAASSSVGLKNVTSLRQLCAYQVALNAEALSSEYLQLAPWSCWEHVWKNILAMGKDSPDIFRMFAKEFGKQPSFWCHEMTLGLNHLDADPRAQALEWALIPGSKKHRMENVFSNVSVSDVVAFVAKLDCSVVVECSNVDNFTAPQLISLACLPNLVALDLSGNNLVDDQFLYTLRLCLTSKDLKLKILRISSCENVTKRGVASLLAADILSPLCYVESDINMITTSTFVQKFLDTPAIADHDPVPNTKWKLLNEAVQTTLQVAHYSLPYKLQYLLRNSDLVDIPSMIWDIKFFSETIDILNSKSAAESYQESWAKRLRSAKMRSAYVPYCYLKDPDQVIVPEVKSKPPVERILPFSRQGTKDTRASKPTIRKPKAIKIDAKSFFGM